MTALLDVLVRAGFAAVAWLLALAAALAVVAAWLAVDALRHRRAALRATARLLAHITATAAPSADLLQAMYDAPAADKDDQ